MVVTVCLSWLSGCVAVWFQSTGFWLAHSTTGCPSPQYFCLWIIQVCPTLLKSHKQALDTKHSEHEVLLVYKAQGVQQLHLHSGIYQMLLFQINLDLSSIKYQLLPIKICSTPNDQRLLKAFPQPPPTFIRVSTQMAWSLGWIYFKCWCNTGFLHGIVAGCLKDVAIRGLCDNSGSAVIQES